MRSCFMLSRNCCIRSLGGNSFQLSCACYGTGQNICVGSGGNLSVVLSELQLCWHEITNLYVLFIFNECWSFALLCNCENASMHTFSSFFLHRQLEENVLTGPILSEISTLTELVYLYVPRLIEVIECWSCTLLCVGRVP